MIVNHHLTRFLTQQSVKSRLYWANLFINNIIEENIDPQEICYDEKEASRGGHEFYQ